MFAWNILNLYNLILTLPLVQTAAVPKHWFLGVASITHAELYLAVLVLAVNGFWPVVRVEGV